MIGLRVIEINDVENQSRSRLSTRLRTMRDSRFRQILEQLSVVQSGTVVVPSWGEDLSV